MEKMKLQIELNNHPYSKNVIYAAVSLRGGYTTRNYLLDNMTHFASNCAFYNVLFNYYRIANEVNGLHFDVQRAVSTVSFCKKQADFIPALKCVLHTLFNHQYDAEKFEEAKQSTREAFILRYKDGAFRSKYKGHEFSELNKRFTLKQLIEDIDKITYEEFLKNAKTIIVPSNVSVYISGETNELDFLAISLEDYEEQFSHTVRIAGYVFDPFLRQEAHVTNIAREEHNLIIESFDFLNDEVTNFTKQLIVETLTELTPAHETDVWVDSLDASIMFATEQLRSYKELLVFESEKIFDVAKRSLLGKYASLLENNPEYFAIKAANLMTVGIYIDQYLSFLDKCPYELFKEVCEKADYKITEAQIVLRKESR
jgi:hypothetical protein